MIPFVGDDDMAKVLAQLLIANYKMRFDEGLSRWTFVHYADDYGQLYFWL